GSCGATRAGFSSASAALVPTGAKPGAVRSGRSFRTTAPFSLRTSKTFEWAALRGSVCGRERLTPLDRCPRTAVRARTDAGDAFPDPSIERCCCAPRSTSCCEGDACVVALAATTVAIAAPTSTAATMIPRFVNILIYRRAGVRPRPSSRPIVIDRAPLSYMPPVSAGYSRACGRPSETLSVLSTECDAGKESAVETADQHARVVPA